MNFNDLFSSFAVTDPLTLPPGYELISPVLLGSQIVASGAGNYWSLSSPLNISQSIIRTGFTLPSAGWVELEFLNPIAGGSLILRIGNGSILTGLYYWGFGGQIRAYLNDNVPQTVAALPNTPVSLRLERTLTNIVMTVKRLDTNAVVLSYTTPDNTLPGDATVSIIQSEAEYRVTRFAGDDAVNPIITSFTATPNTLPAGGGSSLLQFSATGANSLSINNGVGSVTGQTSKSVLLSASKIFTLTATNASGFVTADVSIEVALSIGQIQSVVIPKLRGFTMRFELGRPARLIGTAKLEDDIALIIEDILLARGLLRATLTSGQQGLLAKTIKDALENPVNWFAAQDSPIRVGKVVVTRRAAAKIGGVSLTSSATGDLSCEIAYLERDVGIQIAQAGMSSLIIPLGAFDGGESE